MKKFNLLSKAEMKKVMGGFEEAGGTCMSWCEQGGIRWYSDDKYKSEAIADANADATGGNCSRAGWCCASCPTF
ncbi:MAG: hypothetical protein EOO91_02110 [Pedobacter sp.]|nr:MAG: hypothetical protein EOO91_02110 [Pedobacter sp.]